MKGLKAVAVMALVFTLPAAAQQATLVTTAQHFTFESPTRVGLRSYSVATSAFVAAHPLGSRLSAGAAVQLARGSMDSQGPSSTDLTGLTSAAVFATLEEGRFRLRATFAPAVGETGLSTGELVVASLAGAELLPLPVRGWGRGNDLALDATLRIASAVELFGSLRRHGWFSPFEDDPLEFRLGNEVRLGTRVSVRPSALSWVEFGILASRLGPDRDDRQNVFEPGTRIRVHGTAIFPIARATMLLRGDIYRRGSGSSLDPIGTLENVPRSVFGGGSRIGARTVTSVTLESRSSAGPAQLILTVAGRVAEGPGKDWLAWGGISTDFEVRPPLPGRWNLVPAGRIYRGEADPGRNFDSAIVGWELSVTLGWSGR